MIADILIVIFLMALPVCLLAYLLVERLMHSGAIDAESDVDDLQKTLKEMKKNEKDKKIDADNFIRSKWLQFGAGFYGTAAFYTYIVIEIGEVFSFFGKLIALETWQLNLTFELLIDFIINSITNLVTAFVWFYYWADDLRGVELFLWFGAAWFGYMAGIRLARKRELHTLYDQMKQSWTTD